MKSLFILTVTFLALPQSSMANQSVDSCKARVDFMYSAQIRDLQRSKFEKGADKLLLQTKIQRLEMQALGEKAACEEEQRFAKPDDEYKYPRKMDDDMSEVDFNNLQEFGPQE